jgi:eukaryotic-like serine/threonine-protein kinase
VTVAATLLDNRYWLEEEIGAGGFCEVWRATDTVLRRPVAVKLLRAGYAHQPEARARFTAEARHAGALCHEKITRAYDYGEPAGDAASVRLAGVSRP